MVGRITLSPCMECHKASLKHGKLPDSIMYEILTSDKGVMHFQCKNGHKNTIILQELPFEILIEMAIENIIDKYYREAIFNFAAAQERCFDFFNELILFEKGINTDLYDEVWKNIYQNSSERQLGAFYFLYLMRFGKSFAYENKKINIRNNIIHKGEIATKDHVYEYGKYILNNIYTIMESVTENISTDIIRRFMHQKKDKDIKRINIEKGDSISFMSASIISWGSMTDSEIEQEKKLAQYATLYPTIYAQKAHEANLGENKKLYINEKNELTIINAINTTSQNEKLHYRGRRTLEDLVKQVEEIKKRNMAIKSNLVEKASIISCLNE